MTLTTTAEPLAAPLPSWSSRCWRAIRRNPTIVIGAILLALLIGLAIAAPWITVDPFKQTPANRLRPPSEKFWFGTDRYGRRVAEVSVTGTDINCLMLRNHLARYWPSRDRRKLLRTNCPQ